MLTRTRAILVTLTVLLLSVSIAGCTSYDPVEARQQLVEREAKAEQAKARLDEIDGIVIELQNKLNTLTTDRDLARARADELKTQLDAAKAEGKLTGEQLADLATAAAQARAQADQASNSKTLERLSEELEHWTDARNVLEGQIDTYLDSIERQRQNLDAGTGGTGLGADLQITGEQIQQGARYAPPPVRDYAELLGWAIAGIGVLVSGKTSQKYLQAKKERDEKTRKLEEEGRALDATISSIEAAKQASGLNKVDFYDGNTRRIIDAVQSTVPGLKVRIDLVTSKVDRVAA